MAEGHDIRASARYIPMAPQKVRLVVDLSRGRRAEEALAVLRFTPNAAAKPIPKLLHSAIANAEENYGVNRSDLVVARIFADEAPSRKWRGVGARGRARPPHP